MKKSILLAPLMALATVLSGVTGAGVSSADDMSLYHPSQGWAQSLMGLGNVTSTGAGVSIYILDNGMNVNLPEFGGRASIAKDFFGTNGSYTYGGVVVDHATQMAAVAAGATLGIAKQAKIYDVKVENCDCVDQAHMIEGINWVKNNHDGPSVAVISTNFNTDDNNALRTAVNELAAANVFVAVSAGNVLDAELLHNVGKDSSYNACFNPPADAAGPMIAAASDASDLDVWGEITPPHGTPQKIWSTAIGGCADIFAPGQWIDTVDINGNPRIESGTSYSAPYVAAAAALYKSKFGDASSPTIKTWLLQHTSLMNRVHNSWIYGNSPTGRLNLNGL